MRRQFLLIGTIFVMMVGLAQAQTPKRVHLLLPGTVLHWGAVDKAARISYKGHLITRKRDCHYKQMKPYLFHVKWCYIYHDHYYCWDRFYWKVNTSRKEVHRVWGGNFGKYGGHGEALDIKVDVIGDPMNPKSFTLNLSDAALAFTPSKESKFVSYIYSYNNKIGRLECKRIYPYLYDIRPYSGEVRRQWRNFFWRVNTSLKEVYRIRGGKFGHIGGVYDPLDITVQVEY